MSNAETKPTHNGALMFAAIAGLVAIIGTSGGIMVAIARPMQLRVKSIEETQIRLAHDEKEEHDKVDLWIGEHDRRIEARDASQWERIKSLERETFGHASPVTIAPGDEP